MRIRFFVLCAGLAFSTHPSLFADDSCNSPSLLNQDHDEATIQRLEDAWSAAYSTGDVEFERCLLLPSYSEVKRNGKVGNLTDELNGAAKNKGKTYTPSGAKSEVSMYGDVAVAHGRFSYPGPDGKQMTTRSSDVYVWKDAGWRVIYSHRHPLTTIDRALPQQRTIFSERIPLVAFLESTTSFESATMR
ncbi:nuclear transport factor 2 family protein [Acidobacterium sp. S8]|uniref:nuclear transport factor 2 family protein n=1 Tax=Acidobacterium sp. S8 TaxID=1641854 RepID=UPI00131E61E2|nr:nuclear transport factor 2 family protein [Acidobacterium sp. S8]